MEYAVAATIVYLFVGAVAIFSAGFCRVHDHDIIAMLIFWPISIACFLIFAVVAAIYIAGQYIFFAGRALSERFA